MSKLSMLGAAAGFAALAACLALIPTEPARGLGATPVTVVNPADIAKAEGVQHPYQSEPNNGCNFAGGDSCAVIFKAPTNQRLVIEYISGACAFDNGLPLVQVIVVTTVNGVQVTHRLAITDHNGVVESTVSDVPFGQVVRIYADAGSDIQIVGYGIRFSSNHQTSSFIVSGQAVDAP